MESNASCLVGQANDPFTTGQWVRVYRAVRHQDMVNRLQASRGRLPLPAQRFADQLKLLKDARVAADYLPTDPSNLQSATNWLNIAATVISDFLQLSREERGAVAIITILGRR